MHWVILANIMAFLAGALGLGHWQSAEAGHVPRATELSPVPCAVDACRTDTHAVPVAAQ